MESFKSVSIKTRTVLKAPTELLEANDALVFSLLCCPRPWSQQCSGRELGLGPRPVSTARKGPGWDVPGGPVVKSPPLRAEDAGSISGWGARILHAVARGQIIKTEK